MSNQDDDTTTFQKAKNPAEWVDSLGIRGAVAHLAEIIYSTVYSGGEKPWEETGRIEKPVGDFDKGGKGWGGNPDPSGWQIQRMRDEPSLWKITDAKNVNIAHKFATKELAQQYIDYYRQEYQKPQPPPTGGDIDENGVVKLYRDAQNGINAKFYYKSSNPGRAQWIADLARCCLNLEQTAYFFIKKTQNPGEEVSGKLRGGPHTKDNTAWGCCYIMGVKYSGKVNSQWEEPHPNNHPLPKHEKAGLFDPGNMIGKWFGIKNIVREEGTVDKLECYLDTDPFNNEGKPNNNWRLFWEDVTDKFVGVCNGADDNNKAFWRLDDISATPQNDVEIKFASFREITTEKTQR